MLPYEEVVSRLPLPAAIDVLDEAFRTVDMTSSPLRAHFDVPGGTLLTMPAAAVHGLGVKLVTVCPENRHRGEPRLGGVYALFSPETLALEAVIDGPAITAVRTAAVSAVATRYLAREDAATLAIFGAGVQAHFHLEAVRTVRPIRKLLVMHPRRERAAPLLDAAARQGLDAEWAPPARVDEAQIVCTCTTSTEPLFAGDAVAPGTHVNAIGSYRPDTRELDAAILARATVVVDGLEAVLAEAGEIVLSVGEGAYSFQQIAGQLSDVARGVIQRHGEDEITVFKAVGLALADLVIARALVAAYEAGDSLICASS